MESLINDLWAAEDMADTVIVLSTVLPTTDATGATNRVSVNSQYKALIQTLQSEGRPIVLADMDSEITLADISSDGVHPTDAGYDKMATVWQPAIDAAQDQGIIPQPVALTRKRWSRL